MRTNLAKLCLVLLLSSVGSVSVAQEKWLSDLPEGVNIDLDPKQLFFLFTSGPPKPKFDESGKPVRQKPIKEYGTGFAVSDSVIITAKHVTRSAREFVNDSSNDKIVIPKRTVVYTYAEDETRTSRISEPNKFVWVTPSPIPTTDASRLDLVTGSIKPFPLSACEITSGQQYFLLKFRQSENPSAESGALGNSKNLRVPVAVPIKLDVDIAARLGNLRRFELVNVMDDDNPSKPIGGDSGSPILDKNGQVVGLLTALQGSALWVTPTSSFIDLVPPDVKASVDCKDNIEVTFDILNDRAKQLGVEHDAINKRIDDEIAATTTRFGETNGRVDAHATELESLRGEIAALKEEIAALKSTDEDLANRDVELNKRDDDLDLFIKETDLRSTTVLTAMLLKAEQRGTIPPGQLNDVLNQMLNEKGEVQIGDGTSIEVETLQADLGRLFEQDPVLPAIAQMTEDLGEPRWGFGIVPNAFGLGRPQFNIGYERNISLPLISKEMAFCVRPLYEFKAGVDTTVHSHLDYRSDAFYKKSDKILGSRQFQTSCEWSTQRPSIEIAKSADYGFPLEVAPRFRPNEQPELKMDEPPQFFYGWAYDENSVNYEAETVEILHRFVLEVEVVEGLPQVSCYYLNEQSHGQIADAVAALVEATKSEREEAPRCPEL